MCIRDRDPIEATIRRVEVQAAEAAAAHQGDGGSALNDDDVVESGGDTPSVLRDRDPVEAAIKAAESGAASSADEERVPPPDPTPWPGRDERLIGEGESWQLVAQRLEQGLQDALREMQALSVRLEVLEGSPSASTGNGPAETSTVVELRRHAEHAATDGWDDRPQVSAMAFGTPTRPAVLRDPSPMTATAEEFVPIEAEPEPSAVEERPAARLRAIDEKGNLSDRIPRQYRITVEDKRRGVDLVPLHRAMQAIVNVRDMSLLSYSNGVAMVLVETVGPLDPEVLRAAVGRVMSREALIEVHNEQTMVVKIQEA
jgi:hypothetical protein